MDQKGSSFVVKTLHTEEELALLQKTVDKLYVDQNWDVSWEENKLYSLLDPDCYIVGMLDGEIVSSVCAINCSDTFSLIVTFITRRDLRGQGYGGRVFKAALEHTGNRKVCLFSLPGLAPMYAKYGFVATAIGGLDMLDNSGQSVASANPMIVPAVDVPLNELADFDSRFFPARRENFLKAYISAEGCSTYAYVEDNVIKGYGRVRMSNVRKSAWIGPLFATEPRIAKELTTALLAASKDANTALFTIFEQNPQAVKLVEDLGLKMVIPLDIMYRNGVPDYEEDGAYAACIF